MLRSARLKALQNWVFTTDRHQRIRLVMAGFSCLLTLCGVLIVKLMANAGLARHDWVSWWGALAVTGGLAIFLLLRSGLALQWRDPSLTQLQTRFALVCSATAYVVAGQARGIVPVMLPLLLLFGVFGLTPRKMLGNMTYALVLFAAGFSTVVWLDEPWRVPALEAAYASLIVLVLVGGTFLAIRLQKIRAQLKQQKQELTQALAQIQQLATHDDLTGLPNRRHMMGLLDCQYLRSQRDTRPWMVALIDIDFFKLVNDTHGHAAGDQVLQDFAATVCEAVRGPDTLARWGGEEFLLLLQDTQPSAARSVLERARQAVQDRTVWVQGQPVRVTASIGVATYTSGETVAQLLEKADQALYRAKAEGRNRVVEAEPPTASAVQTSGLFDL